MSEKRSFYVFQDWIARKLAEEGFKYIVREDRKDKTRNVYVFENNSELRHAFFRITSE